MKPLFVYRFIGEKMLLVYDMQPVVPHTPVEENSLYKKIIANKERVTQSLMDPSFPRPRSPIVLPVNRKSKNILHECNIHTKTGYASDLPSSFTVFEYSTLTD